MAELIDGPDGPVVLASVRAAYSGARCRTCRAPVIWTETVNGRRLALDVTPTADGRVELVRALGSVCAVQHATAPPSGSVRYRVHVASCTPRQRGWRGRQKVG